VGRTATSIVSCATHSEEQVVARECRGQSHKAEVNLAPIEGYELFRARHIEKMSATLGQSFRNAPRVAGSSPVMICLPRNRY